MMHRNDFDIVMSNYCYYYRQCFFKVWLEEPLSNFERPLIFFLLFLSVLSFVYTIVADFERPLDNFERPFRFLKTPKKTLITGIVFFCVHFPEPQRNVRGVWVCFHYERGMEYSLFLLLIFFASLSASARREMKKSIIQTKNAPFRARSGSGSLYFEAPLKQCFLIKLSLF